MDRFKSIKIYLEPFYVIIPLIIFAVLIYATYRGEGVITATVFAVIGILFSIPAEMINQIYKRPILVIKGSEDRIFHLSDSLSTGLHEYLGTRLIIENNGKSAAKNCKGYLVTNICKERIRWLVGNEKVIINQEDNERLDTFAFYQKSNHPNSSPVPFNYCPAGEWIS